MHPCASLLRPGNRETSAQMQDARVVLAYAPKDKKGPQGVCSWPWAHALHSAALEGLQVTLSLLSTKRTGKILLLGYLARAAVVHTGFVKLDIGKLLGRVQC